MSPAVPSLGRFLLWTGLLVAGLGAVLLWGPRLPWLGRLPGDFMIRREHVSFYFPLTSSILVSLLLSAFLWLIHRFRS